MKNLFGKLIIFYCILILSSCHMRKKAIDYFHEGRNNIELGKYEEAIQCFNQYIKDNPDDEASYYNLYEIYSIMGKDKEAVEALKELLKINPNSSKAKNILETYQKSGTIQYKTKNDNKKLDLSEYRIKGNPYYVNSEHRKIEKEHSVLTLGKNSENKVKVYFKEAVDHYGQGVEYLESETYSKAIEEFKEVIRIDPNIAEAYIQLAYSYAKLNRFDNAAEYLNKALKINPKLNENEDIRKLSIYIDFAEKSTKNDKLIEACKNGKLELVKLLIADGADVNAIGLYGDTVLIFAVKSGRLDIVKYLVEKGGNVNSRGSYSDPVLMFAVEADNLEVVKYLVEKGANVNIDNQFSTNSLMLAASAGNLEVVKYLVEKGMNINAGDGSENTVLMYATSKGRLEVAKYLIEKGADINVKSKYKVIGTALTSASSVGNLELVKYLVEKGANINIKDNSGGTALLYACSSGNLELVKYLVEKGMDVINTKDNNGKTALMYAIVTSKDNLEIVKYLVEKGADINVRNSKDEAALDYAIKKKYTEIEKFLREKMQEKK